MNTLRAFAATVVSAGATVGWLIVGPPAAPAEPVSSTSAEPPSETATVDGVDYPVCSQEDCSDQPGQIGIWFDRSGAPWLSLGEHSVRIER